MSCTLTINFGYTINGVPQTETHQYSVPDGSYRNPYKVNRIDLGFNGTTNKVYSVDCDGTQGVIRLATFYPGAIDVTITSAVNSCPALPIAYDCINGACVGKDVYNTPGIYRTLSDCEQACGTGCSGKCISNADWAQIEGLASQLKNKNCS